MTTYPLFFNTPHPFVWSTSADRDAVLANVNEPVWHRFLEESDRHFLRVGGLRPAKFPVYCHDGDLDEVMAAAVLATVRGDRKTWDEIAAWLREAISYFHQALPGWRKNSRRIFCGENPGVGNTGQFFEGFTEGGRYWVEAGLMSVLLHLFDLLEANASDALSEEEKLQLCAALSDFANRFAFHEEALKYSNRGLWANSGILIAALTHADPEAARLLLHRAESRNEEFRATFFDDGMHAEGAPDYHLMSVDGLLCYALTASQMGKGGDYFTAKEKDGTPFRGYPGVFDLVRAYLRTVIPGETLWNNPRGCSVSIPIPLRPSLIYAYNRTRDPEIGWFIRQREEAIDFDLPNPLGVTPVAVLGLGHYQPLLNFWLYRPVTEARPPLRKMDVLPDHGAALSRSGWGAEDSCVTVRFGYEGTGKGHRDFGHVTALAGGREILSDPFPRFGPRELETSLFHNTVTVGHIEPPAVIGSLDQTVSLKGADAWLIRNAGGKLPGRIYLHDPRDETNYWFTSHPAPAPFAFQRAILHVHHSCVALVDRVASPAGPIDWFFHTPLRPGGYASEAAKRSEIYQLQQRNVITPAAEMEIVLTGPTEEAPMGRWFGETLGDQAGWRVFPLDAPMQVDRGHHSAHIPQSTQTTVESEVVDYYLRGRVSVPEARIVCVVHWGGKMPTLAVETQGDRVIVAVDDLRMEVDFPGHGLKLGQ
ncbi:hypothetical protein BH09VER1_BH09VER1_13280 [soil metagenome]